MLQVNEFQATFLGESSCGLRTSITLFLYALQTDIRHKPVLTWRSRQITGLVFCRFQEAFSVCTPSSNLHVRLCVHLYSCQTYRVFSFCDVVIGSFSLRLKSDDDSCARPDAKQVRSLSRSVFYVCERLSLCACVLMCVGVCMFAQQTLPGSFCVKVVPRMVAIVPCSMAYAQ